jgi:formylglycine-generating enzyme required for sulfatase activity
MTVDEARGLQQMWADFLGQRVVEGGPAGVQTVLIPPGTWELAPRYHVTITRPYRLGTTEVTRKQFLTFLHQTRYIPTLDQAELFKALGTSARPQNETGTWQEPGFPASDETPMTHVSRADAEAFVEWLGRADGKKYRLPTEAEWRWACRSGAATRWPFGDDPKDLGYYARYQNNTRGFPERVGVLRPNAWGLYDMLGNVREWVTDGIAPYPEGRFTDPTVPAKNGMYMLCGGDFNGMTRYTERQPGYGSATCDCSTATARYWYLCTKTGGFRVCREP